MGSQLLDNALANPGAVLINLHVAWKAPGGNWTGPRPGPFRASPVVFNKTVFIGDINGVFWAIDAQSGNPLWHYPPTGSSLNGSCAQGGNGSWGQYGIQSSAAYALVGGQDAVIFGAPDPDPGTDGGNGSARLWALNAANGSLIWKSDVVAHVNGCPGPLHERIAYSSPLVAFGRIYVGVHDAADNPVQKGKIVAVDVNGGKAVLGFSFAVVGAPADLTCGGVCGGGVWDSLATDGRSILLTTGNVCDSPLCETEPSPDYSLSIVSINPATGAHNWNFRAVPYQLDADPDWSAGPTVNPLASCAQSGQLAASVQKDGWSYAVNTADGSCRWQFPPTAEPETGGCAFSPTDALTHGDNDYKQPGAAWGDYLFIETGGYARATDDDVTKGYGLLHALDMCQDDAHRVRWIAEPDPALVGQSWPYPLGAPVVTGGMVYVTTARGHVVALADPSVAAPAGYRCSNVDFTLATCPAPYSPVPVPASRDVALDDSGNAVGLRMEPAIALDKLYVATDQGHVYALSP